MKKTISALLLVLAVVCAAGLIWRNIPRTALLENDLPEDPDQSSAVSIKDEDVPLTDLPAMGEADADLFASFTEEQQAVLNEVLALVNAARADAGLSPLTLDPVLCGAAQVRASECVGTFSHTRPDGSKYKTAITEAGIAASYTGENIATGHTTAKQVVEAWMNSEGHRANILNEHYTSLGVGFAANTGNRYKGFAWAQLFMSDPT